MDPRDMRDLLSLLSLPQNASAEQIKRAYRKLALQLHPDKGGNAELMKKLNDLMQQYKDNGHAQKPDLGCDESPLSEEEEDADEGTSSRSSSNFRGASSGFFSQETRDTFNDSQDSAHFGTPSSPVSAQEYCDAYLRLVELRHSLHGYFQREERRKQRHDPDFHRLRSRFYNVPWGTFGRLFRNNLHK